MLFFLKTSDANAVIVSCSGSYTCHVTETRCSPGCFPGNQLCSISACPNGVPAAGTCCSYETSSYPMPCGGLPGAACAEQSLPNCVAGGYAQSEDFFCYDSCSPGGCQSGGACASGFCCSGGSACVDNYCSAVGFNCANQSISTPTPTPCPYGAGTTNYQTYCSGNSVRESYDTNAGGVCGHSDNFVANCANGCSNGACIGVPTSTPTPIPTNTPTPAVCGGASFGSCPNGQNCIFSGVVWVCQGFTSTPTQTPTQTPTPTTPVTSCAAGTFACGTTCCQTGIEFCTGAPQSCYPIGCPNTVGTACVNDAGCCTGLVCISGACAVPSPTPTPIVGEIAGGVFVDVNRDGVRTFPGDYGCPYGQSWCQANGYNSVASPQVCYYDKARRDSSGVQFLNQTCVTYYQDVNNNGVFDAPEPLLGNQQINLSGGQSATTYTSNNLGNNSFGTFTFSNLAPNTSYTVTLVSPPTGYQITTSNGVARFIPSSGGSQFVDFGVGTGPVTPPPPRELYGSVFIDLNKDGIKQVGESNYTANTVNFQFHGNFSDQTINFYCPPPSTDSLGNFVFTEQTNPQCYNNGLTAITSMEALTILPGYNYIPSSTKGVTFTGGANSVASQNPLDFAVYPAVTFLGRLYQGSSSPGVVQTTGVVRLYDSGLSEIASRFSSPWDFTDEDAGTYYLIADDKPGYTTEYKCNNGNCISQNSPTEPDLPTAYALGNGFEKTLLNSGNYVDVYFRYVPDRTPPCSAGPSIGGYGDVSGDGVISGLDVAMAMQIALGFPGYTSAQVQRADVTGSNGITSADTLRIRSYLDWNANQSEPSPPAAALNTFPVCTAVTPTATPVACSGAHVVSGRIYEDLGGNNCASGFAQLTSIAPIIQLFNTTAGTNLQTTYSTASQTYSITDTMPNACAIDSRQVTISNVGTYTVSQVRVGTSGVWQTPISGFSSPEFNFTDGPATIPVDFCLSTYSSWFQVGTGDVRFPNLVNNIPSSGVASTGTGATSSLFFSSDDPASFNGKSPSATNWVVGQEYDYNSDFKNGLGSMSYTFYTSQARKKNITITSIPGSAFAFSDTTPSGIYQKTGGGPLTVNTSSLSAGAGKHIIVLASGNVTINGDINVVVGGGNLFILAAKGDIIIPNTIGTTTLNSTATQLDGYYTSERDIIIQGGLANCAASVPDRRLNVSGALIANSLRPFTTGGSGEVLNQRTLCGTNATQPTYTVVARPDFLTQLTDFYKTTYKTFREVNP